MTANGIASMLNVFNEFNKDEIIDTDNKSENTAKLE